MAERPGDGHIVALVALLHDCHLTGHRIDERQRFQALAAGHSHGGRNAGPIADVHDAGGGGRLLLLLLMMLLRWQGMRLSHGWRIGRTVQLDETNGPRRFVGRVLGGRLRSGDNDTSDDATGAFFFG